MNIRTVRHPSNFYEYNFPYNNKPPNTCRKDHQCVFSEYGCMEAINVEFNECIQKYCFTAKKQKPSLDKTEVHKYRFYVPSHSALPLGEPEQLVKLLNVPLKEDLVNNRQPLSGDRNDKQYIPDVEEHLNNFLLDHPDAAQGTLLEQIAHYFPYWSKEYSQSKCVPNQKSKNDCGGRIPKQFLPRHNLGCAHQKYPSYVDPFMFDIPHKLLNNLLVEEINSEIKCLLYDAAFTGGALCYRFIGCKKNFSYGVLFRPGGEAMNELSFQLLCTDANIETDGSVVEEFVPNLHLGSDHRSVLNGRILQINTQPSFNDDSLIFSSTRSMHNVLMTSLDVSQCELLLADDDQYDKIQYSSNCVSHLGVFQTQAVVTSACVSPYIDGECAVALDDGKIFLWDSNSAVNHYQTDTISPAWNRKLMQYDNGWRQVEFGSHPRHLLVAGRHSIKMLDLRGKPNKKKLYVIPNKNDEQNRIMSILSGTNFAVPHEFQFVVATPSELQLCDVRHCNVPLLTWNLNMKNPCQHLAVIGASSDDEQFNLNSVIMAASQRSQDLHIYQYNTKAKPRNAALRFDSNRFALQPPVSTAPVYACETFRDFRRAMGARYFRCHGYLDDRLSSPIVGLSGFSYKTKSGRSGMVTLQLSGSGDLMFQPFHLESPSIAWKSDNIVSGLKSRSSEVEKRNSDNVERIRTKWATKACEKYLEEIKKRSSYSLRSSRTTLSSKDFSSKNVMQSLIKFHRCKLDGECILCQNPVEDFRDSQKSPNFDKNCDTAGIFPVNNQVESLELTPNICGGCGSDKNIVQSILDCHKSAVFHPNILNEEYNNVKSFWDSWSQPQAPVNDCQVKKIKPLKLVEPSVFKMGLGRVLWSTWDASYEELWDTIEKEIAAEKSEKKAKKYEERFDLDKTTTAFPAEESNRPTSCSPKTVESSRNMNNSPAQDSSPHKQIKIAAVKSNQNFLNYEEQFNLDRMTIPHLTPDQVSTRLFEDIETRDLNHSCVGSLITAVNEYPNLCQIDDKFLSPKLRKKKCDVSGVLTTEVVSPLRTQTPVIKQEIVENLPESLPCLASSIMNTQEGDDVVHISKYSSFSPRPSQLVSENSRKNAKKSLKRKMTGFL